jgi:class 3 adenylate cyclase/tetratricopeptide (TPR) repeat protein
MSDIRSYSTIAEHADPSQLAGQLNVHRAAMNDAILGESGTVMQFVGDAVMAVFGAPIAHEDDPERAVRAALAIRDSIGDELQIRTAVNTGEALVALGAKPGEGDAMVAGDVVNTAARLQGSAPVNGILVGEGTYRATRQAIDYREAPSVEAKGKAEPVKVWEAVGARARFGSDVEQKLRTPLVGRERERNLLADAFQHARREQSVQLVTLVGVPGIGKSRLVAELFQITDADEEIISWRQGRSLPYGERASFWALSEIVKAHAGILESDDTATAEGKLVAMVETLGEDERERDWLARNVRPLLGLESAGQADRDEAFAAWRRLIEAAAEQRPLILVFEDLHWADDGLLDFVDHLADWATTVPLLIVATARPELLDRRPGWSGGKRNAITISIGALSNEETAQLLQRLLDRAVLDADAQQAVLQRAEGNPLYAEEYARMLAEHDGGDLPLPETVQGLIAARIDGLAPEEKSLLQDASVIGKVFWPGALTKSDEHVLHALERKEFVRRDRRSAIAGETQYAFLHALVREVGYGQIPRSDRAEKHRRAAEWLASLAGDRTEDHAEMLASHYREALTLSKAAGLDTSGLREPARRAFADAAQRALSLGASGTAYELAYEAIDLTDEGDADLPALQLLAAYGGRDLAEADVTGLLEEAVDGFLAQGDTGRAAETAQVLAREFYHRGNVPSADAASERAIGLARSVPLSTATARAIAGHARHVVVAHAEYAEGIGLAREALAFADETGDDRLAMHTLNTIGMAGVYSGDEAGVADMETAVERGRNVGAVFELGTALNNLGNTLATVGRLDDSEARLEESRELSERYGITAGIVWNEGERVYQRDRRGDLDGTLAAADRFLAHPYATENYQLRPVLTCRARVFLARGQIAEAVADIDKVLGGEQESNTDAQTGAWLLTVSARCLRATGRGEEAEKLLKGALEAPYDALVYDLALELVELGRGDAFLARPDDQGGHRWDQAHRAAASGELTRASEIYGTIGARFPEAWAALLAAERGDTSRLEPALAYFEEQQATPYSQRCRALMQASA